MKTFKVTMTASVSDDTYEKEIRNMKDDILSGQLQRELNDKKIYLSTPKMTFELLK